VGELRALPALHHLAEPGAQRPLPATLPVGLLPALGVSYNGLLPATLPACNKLLAAGSTVPASPLGSRPKGKPLPRLGMLAMA